MKASEAPAFLVEKRTIKPRVAKTSRKRAKSAALRIEGDTGTPEMKLRQKVVLEARDRSSTGHITSVGARIEAQLPHDVYRVRQLLDREDEWSNLMRWQAAERLRQDFETSGMAPRICSSFVPRVSGGFQQWTSDKRVDAFKRYKKALAAVGSDTGSGIPLRSILFYVCISGEHASEWARRNGKTPQVGIELLRMALIDLCHHYGLAKKKSDAEKPNDPN
jgi:hypothetical protein